MTTSITKKGLTPNGGTSSTAYFLDDKGDPVDKGKATNVRIVELDDKGSVIHTTYGTLGGPTTNTNDPIVDQPTFSQE